MNMLPPADASADSLSDMSILKILRDAFKVTAKKPNGDDPAVQAKVRNLAESLRLFRKIVPMRMAAVEWERDHIEKVGNAVWALVELLPTIRPNVVKDVEESRRFGFDLGTEQGEADLRALDSLQAAAEAFKERRLPRKSLLTIGAGARRWRGIAHVIKDDLDRDFPEMSEEAAYGFIKTVIPELTGDKPTLGAVKIELVRKRSDSP